MPSRERKGTSSGGKSIDPGFSGNSLLDSLPEPSRVRLLSLLKLQAVEQGESLARPDQPFSNVVFPIGSMISTVILTQGGSTVEVGVTGHEGVAPLPIAFGSRVSRHAAVVQIRDSALFMSVQAFMVELNNDVAMRDRCLRYAEYSFGAATQFAACNAVHTVEERYARWILMAADRVGRDDFDLTQDYSAQMLGVRRATVSTIAFALAQQGLISYRRSHMSVIDRDGLEDAACECYRSVNDDLQRIMGYSVSQPDRS